VLNPRFITSAVTNSTVFGTPTGGFPTIATLGSGTVATFSAGVATAYQAGWVESRFASPFGMVFTPWMYTRTDFPTSTPGTMASEVEIDSDINTSIGPNGTAGVPLYQAMTGSSGNAYFATIAAMGASLCVPLGSLLPSTAYTLSYWIGGRQAHSPSAIGVAAALPVTIQGTFDRGAACVFNAGTPGLSYPLTPLGSDGSIDGNVTAAAMFQQTLVPTLAGAAPVTAIGATAPPYSWPYGTGTLNAPVFANPVYLSSWARALPIATLITGTNQITVTWNNTLAGYATTPFLQPAQATIAGVAGTVSAVNGTWTVSSSSISGSVGTVVLTAAGASATSPNLSTATITPYTGAWTPVNFTFTTPASTTGTVYAQFGPTPVTCFSGLNVLGTGPSWAWNVGGLSIAPA